MITQKCQLGVSMPTTSIAFAQKVSHIKDREMSQSQQPFSLTVGFTFISISLI